MATVGRNEPCPCGSGKKYKKCCLAKDSAIDLDTLRADRAEEGLRGEILKFATGDRFTDEMPVAYMAYMGGAPDANMLAMGQDQLENIRFLDWFIHEYSHSEKNKSIIDMFDEVRSKALDDDQKKLLVEWKASRLGAFEVDSVDAETLKLSDVFGDGSYSIEDESAREEVEPGMVMVARVTTSWGKGKLGGAPVLISAESKQKLVDAVTEAFEKHKEDHADAELAEFASENSHLIIAAAKELA
jgi:hypothetical protein